MRAPALHRCSPAPPTAEGQSKTMLDGSAGGLHGVRSLILMTPEWNAKGTREALAAALEAAGDAQGLAPVLRAKASSKLTKAQLLQLCAAWGYAHQAFRTKGELTRKRPRNRAAVDASTAANSVSRLPDAAASPPAVSPPNGVPRAVDSTLLDAFDAESVSQFMAGPLGAIQHVSCGALEGPRARSAVEKHRLPHCSSTALDRYRAVSSACGAATAKMAELQGAQAVWANAATEASNSGDRSAVWLMLPMLGGAAPADAALEILRGGCTATSRASWSTRPATATRCSIWHATSSSMASAPVCASLLLRTLRWRQRV